LSLISFVSLDSAVFEEDEFVLTGSLGIALHHSRPLLLFVTLVHSANLARSCDLDCFNSG